MFPINLMMLDINTIVRKQIQSPVGVNHCQKALFSAKVVIVSDTLIIEHIASSLFL